MAKPAWSNEVQKNVQHGLEDIEEEVKTPTPRELDLAKKAETAKTVTPLRYDITSKNTNALRVVHDHSGRSIVIPPGETKHGVLLRPDTAEILGKGDLTLIASPS